MAAYKQPTPAPAASARDDDRNYSEAKNVRMTVGNISKNSEGDGVESDGIKIRGTGAATKGIKARGPMG